MYHPARLLTLLCLPLAALAAERPPEPTLAGAGVRSRPAYDGSASQVLEAVPVLRYSGPLLFVRSTRGPLEGGVHFEILPGLQAGALLAYEPGRRTSESTLLTDHHLANLGTGGSYGGFLEWNGMAGPSPINFIVRTRKHLKAGQGTQADLRLTAGVFQAGPFSAGLVAGATWASARATGSIYDIPPQQAAAIGLPAFTAGAGWLSNSLGVIGSFDLARHWQLVGNLEGRRLRGDAARSPLAERGSNLTTTLGAACRF